MREERVTGEPPLRLLRASDQAPSPGGPVALFVHGATFPAGLASGYRFGDGTSWMDATVASGCDAWALDFAGSGGSDRYPEMAGATGQGPPLGRAPAAATQIARAAEHIRRRSGAEKVSIVAHSWAPSPRRATRAPIPPGSSDSCSSDRSPAGSWSMISNTCPPSTTSR